MNVNYTSDIPKNSDVMLVTDYRKHVASGLFIDYDGFGYPAKGGKMDATIVIRPSKPDSIPPDATHVVWFNR